MYRLGTSLRVLPWLTLVASLSRAARPPSLLELFGDRSFLAGNPDLRAETASGGDAGFVIRKHSYLWSNPIHFRSTSRFFAMHMSDLIRYTRTAQFTASPANLRRALILGAESEVATEWGDLLRLNASFTYVRSRDSSGRELPLRPRLVAFLEPEFGQSFSAIRGEVRAFARVHHTGANYVDEANLVQLAARTRLSLGLRVAALEERLAFSATVEDVFNARGTDLLGFPLSGRAFALRASVRQPFAL